MHSFFFFFYSSGQTIPTFKRNRSQHYWTPTCCSRLATMLQRVATCCELKIELMRIPRRNIVARTLPIDCNIQHPLLLHEKFDHFQIWANNTQHVATHFWTFISVNLRLPLIVLVPILGWKLEKMTSYSQKYRTDWDWNNDKCAKLHEYRGQSFCSSCELLF